MNTKNFPTKFEKIIRLQVVLIAVVALVFGFYCAEMFVNSSTHTEINGSHISVSTSTGHACCGSDILHRSNTWNNTLIPLPQRGHENLMLLILGTILVFGSSYVLFNYSPPNSRLIAMRLYTKQNPDFTLFDHLKLAFASGILNPKIY